MSARMIEGGRHRGATTWAVEAQGLVVAPAFRGPVNPGPARGASEAGRRRGWFGGSGRAQAAAGDDGFGDRDHGDHADHDGRAGDDGDRGGADARGRDGLDRAGLDRAGLVVPHGGVHALVGDGRSGVGTLLAVLVGLVRPEAGTVSVAGHDPVTAPGDVRARTGWVGRGAPVFPDLSASEALATLLAAQGLPRDRARERVSSLLQTAGLTDAATRRAARLEPGPRRRLAVAQAIVHDPAVLLLDSVFDDLDPEDHPALADLLRGIAATGTTVLVGAADPLPLEGLCTNAFAMSEGRVTAAHDLGLLTGGGRWRIASLDGDLLTDALDELEIVHDTVAADERENRRAVAVAMDDEREAVALLRRLAARGVPVVDFTRLGTTTGSAGQDDPSAQVVRGSLGVHRPAVEDR